MATGEWGKANGPMLAAHDPDTGAMKTGKISEMILDFATPIVDQLVQAKAPVQVWRDAMKFVLTVWNAHVMAMPHHGKPEYLAELMVAMTGPAAPAEMKAMFLALSDERRTRFASIPLAVGEWSIRELPDGGMVFRCDARLPKQR